MPSTFTVVKCWRWPRLRWVFLRRFFLKAMTFSPWPCSTISHWTEAPDTSGAPILGAVAAQHQDLKVQLGADVTRQAFDLQDGVLGHFILFSAGADDRVHGLNL